jgi:ABC-type transport system involved in cytochrome c biogenesis permease subunit
MEIKHTVQGLLIYIAMGGYLAGFAAALSASAIRFQPDLKTMGRRAVIFGFRLLAIGAVVSGLVSEVLWIKLRVFPLETFLIVLGVFALVSAGSCLLGLGAVGLHWAFRRLLVCDMARLKRLTVRLAAITVLSMLVAGISVIAAYALRWYHVRHVPMQNLFEVFLTLGVFIIPISLFCRRFLAIKSLATDLLAGAIVLFPAGFLFEAEPQHLPPALQSWLFGPHVAVYVLSYLFMFKAALQAVFQVWTYDLAGDNLRYERSTYDLVRVGFPLLTLGLILGSVWGKLAWGDYWGWDPKELWSLASWLVYVAYFHWRHILGVKRPRLNSLWAIAGAAAIVITLLWVNLSSLFSGMHSYAT